MSSGSEEKTLPPTARKLRQARRRGEFARSREIVTAMVTLTAFAMLFLSAPVLMDRFADAIRATALLEDLPFADALGQLTSRLAWVGVEVLVPFAVLLAGTATLTGIISNGGLVFSMHPILPKLERLDPAKGFGRLFKLRSLVELLKSGLKLSAVLVTFMLLIRNALNTLVQQPACGLPCLPNAVRAIFLPLVVACCGIFLVLGLFDLGVQRWLFRREMRMTRSEHKRDHKDSEGNPQLMAERRKEQREVGRLGAKTGIRHATFVIRSAETALAFRYITPEVTVPILVARMSGDQARLMLAEARRLDLPIVFDEQAMNALLGRVQLGKMVPQATFPFIIQCMRTAGIV